MTRFDYVLMAEVDAVGTPPTFEEKYEVLRAGCPEERNQGKEIGVFSFLSWVNAGFCLLS